MVFIKIETQIRLFVFFSKLKWPSLTFVFLQSHHFYQGHIFLFCSVAWHSALSRAWFHVQWCVRMKYLYSSSGFHVLWFMCSSVYHWVPYYPESALGVTQSHVFIDYAGHGHICRYIKFALYFSCTLFVGLCFSVILVLYEFILGKHSDSIGLVMVPLTCPITYLHCVSEHFI